MPSLPESAAPVEPSRRIESIDTLRGFALLGILVMNIAGMALPFAAYFSPVAYGEPTPWSYGAWVFAHLFFELKMMGIFSMLFGAGVVLMTGRDRSAGGKTGRVWYRRMLWLLVIGLVHAYLVWHGDILVTYALCGVFLYLFRRRSIRALLINGVVFLLVGSLLAAGGGFAQGKLRDVVEEIRGKVAAGQVMTPHRQGLVDQWEGMRKTFAPTPEENARTVERMRSGTEAIRVNMEEAVLMHTQAVPFELFWRAMGMMLLGMGLMKAGVFTGERSPRFYRRWMLAGFGVGLPLIVVGVVQWRRHDHDFIARFLVDGQYNYVGAILVALAYVSAVMLWCRSGRLPGLRGRLAAVGRMALTNYLLQSLVGVALFYGYGLGLFGRVDRPGLWLFILGIWILQLLVSPWWLARFRFGPVEWLWRALTYGRRPPMRIEAPSR